MKKRITKYLITGLAIVATAVMLIGTSSVFAASAPSYDLTTDNATLTATINGAIWERFPVDTPTGTGNFNTFHQVQAHPEEQGYNTDYTPKQFNEGSSANYNRSFLLSDMYQEQKGGVIYYEFQLDINEQKSDPNWYISLDTFQVWVTNNPNLNGYVVGSPSGSFPSGAQLVYDLDGDGDTYIKMDFRTNPGSG